jgi:hypothetical protein
MVRCGKAATNPDFPHNENKLKPNRIEEKNANNRESIDIHTFPRLYPNASLKYSAWSMISK